MAVYTKQMAVFPETQAAFSYLYLKKKKVLHILSKDISFRNVFFDM